MTIEILGDIVLTSEYWDCECRENYIRIRSEKKCPTCSVFRSEQPLSRVNEVVAAGLPLMNIDQIKSQKTRNVSRSTKSFGQKGGK